MGIFQVVHWQVFQAQQVRNIYYYETITGNPSTSEWQDIVDEIRVDWDTHLKSKMTPMWAFNQITYRQVDVVSLPSFTVLPTAGVLLGTNVGDEVPAQVALVVSVKGATAPPRNARTYLAGMGAGNLFEGLVTASMIAAAELFIDLQSVLNAAGTNELQRVSAQWNTAHTQVIDFNNIAGSASAASPVPATQRRRRIGVGI